MRNVLRRSTQKYIELFANPRIIAIVTILVLIAPILINLSIKPLSSEPYLNIRLSQALFQEDSQSYGGRPFSYAIGTPIIINVLSNFLSYDIILSIIPRLLGLISVFLLLFVF